MHDTSIWQAYNLRCLLHTQQQHSLAQKRLSFWDKTSPKVICWYKTKCTEYALFARAANKDEQCLRGSMKESDTKLVPVCYAEWNGALNAHLNRFLIMIVIMSTPMFKLKLFHSSPSQILQLRCTLEVRCKLGNIRYEKIFISLSFCSNFSKVQILSHITSFTLSYTVFIICGIVVK